ncbi:hypothetical protein [Paenibacillus sp. NRS-1760]|uniref:hypothetical protein n=1 Tax=Paenibacillus sp. NRS-1760 TaxID=3233902 RepID=UPI003D27F754
MERWHFNPHMPKNGERLIKYALNMQLQMGWDYYLDKKPLIVEQGHGKQERIRIQQ